MSTLNLQAMSLVKLHLHRASEDAQLETDGSWKRTCIISVGALILEMSLMLGKTSSHEGHRVHVGFMTLMPVARGLCSMTPARPGTLAPRWHVGPEPTL